jgi:hypothetical protein
MTAVICSRAFYDDRQRCEGRENAQPGQRMAEQARLLYSVQALLQDRTRIW